MAKLDMSIAEALFEEQNNRKPYMTEYEMLAQVQQGVIMKAGVDDFCVFWDNFYNPPVPEKDVDWDAMATDVSKWGLI